MTVRISAASRDAALDAVLSRINIGGAGSLKIYSGAQPASPDTAPGVGNTLLATFTLNNPAFSAAGPGDLTKRAAAMNLPTPLTTNAVADGTAAWARIVNGAGTAIYDGLVNPSSGDFQINFTALTTGQQIKLTAGALSFPL